MSLSELDTIIDYDVKSNFIYNNVKGDKQDN